MLLTLSKAAAKQHLFTELPGKLIKVKRSNFCPAYYTLLGKTKGKNWVHTTFASELINAPTDRISSLAQLIILN